MERKFREKKESKIITPSAASSKLTHEVFSFLQRKELQLNWLVTVIVAVVGQQAQREVGMGVRSDH